MPILSIIATVLIMVCGYFTAHQYHHQIDMAITAHIKKVDSIFHAVLSQRSNGMATAIQIIAADPDVKNDLLSGNRDHLISIWKPIFQAMREENNIRDISADKNTFIHLMIRRIIAGGSLLVVLISFLYVLLKRTDDNILFQQRILSESEESLKKSHDEMEQRVSERTSELIHQQNSLLQEIMEREKAEEALRESEEKYRDIIRHMNDGYFETDLRGNMTFCNPVIPAFLGYSTEEMTGMNHKSYLDDENMAAVTGIFNKVYIEDIPSQIFSYEVTRRDGLKLPVETSFSLIKNSSGKPVGYRGVVRDISTRKREEKEKEIREIQFQQSRKLETLGTLAGGIAHDFNNILFPIVGFTEMSLLNAIPGTDLHENLNEILKASLRATDLVKQILTFSRQGGREPIPTKIQLILKESVKLIRSSIPSTITIIENIDEQCGMTLVDPTHIHQISMNLMTNAFQAMEENGGTLYVRLSQVTVSPENLPEPAFHPGEYIRLTIADTGHGMNEDIRGRIFEPYFTTKPQGKGTGLGLSVVHGIIKSYNGDIRVNSKPGKGALFDVYLPVFDTDRENDVTESDHMDFNGDNEHILLVDDEEAILKIQKKILEQLGYRVTSTINCQEALEAFQAPESDFDLVITDMTMPGMNGLKLASEIKRINKNIPVILCTGYSSKITENNEHAASIDGFLMKPIVKSGLSQKIRLVLDQKKGALPDHAPHSYH